MVKIYALLSVWVLLLMLSGAASAQPKAVGPDDVQRQLQMTVISSDWSDTQAFDLDNPVDVPVRIQGVHVPRVGYAELYYKLDLDDAYLRSAGADPDAVYVAIMQEVSTIKSMNLPLKTLNNNRKAVLRGWHATPQNFLSSSFLIDEIKLADSREHFAMHANNPAMDVRKAAVTNGSNSSN